MTAGEIYGFARAFTSFSINGHACTRAKTGVAYSESTRLWMGRNLEPLAKEGPWTAYLDDETTGLVYYFNSETGESSWDPPTKTFPPIKMSKRLEEKMLVTRQNYEKRIGFEEATEMRSAGNLDGKNSSVNDKGIGIFGQLFSPKQAKVETMVVVEEQTIAKSEIETAEDMVPTNGSFFGVLFGGNKKSQVAVQEEEYYDQLMFEDAVPVVEEDANQNKVLEDTAPVVVDKAKKSFVDDIMTFASFPTTQKDAKIVEAAPKKLKFQIASKILPHPAKISWGGEDAIFVSGRSFGIFDGVSGAEKLDGVPLYSNTLAKRLKSDIGSDESLSIEEIKTKLLSAAEYADVSATGASTAVIASIGDDDVMRSLCLGDSVIMVIRDGSVVAKTKETLHYFDCPYQLSEDSPDRPRDGTILSTKLVPGDIVVAGSDGVFDNLEDTDIIQFTLDSNIKSKPALIAQKIVAESRKVSLDPEAPTPYAKQAKRNRYQNYATGLGGKLDDISCIVVSISSE
jgi:protein phosphatase PTC7